MLRAWLQYEWLIEHQTSIQEIADLLAAAESDLHNARVTGLSADWRMSIAYTAAMRLASAALAASGYRATSSTGHHYYLIESLAYTIELDSATIRQLDAFRKKRNFSQYDRAGSVSSREAEEMIALAQHLQRAVVAWLQAEKPELMP